MKDITKAKVQVHYLGYYLKWHSRLHITQLKIVIFKYHQKEHQEHILDIIVLMIKLMTYTIIQLVLNLALVEQHMIPRNKIW